jgi:CIC family chloride channel protein
MRLADFSLIAYLKSRRPGEKRFLVLVPLTGAFTGLAAVALIRLLGAVQALFWGSGHDLVARAHELPRLHRFLAPAIGGLLVGLFALALHRPVRGHGTAAIIEAVALRGGVLPMLPTLTMTGATIVTVASGGALGREGPMMRVGAALGSLLGRRFGLSGHRLKILLGCGAAAGIAAAYNAPIGGALFALEVVLGNFALESFGPIVVASVMGTLVARYLLGASPAYSPPAHIPLVSGWELGHYLVMGLLIGLASALFLWVLKGAAKGFERLPLPAWTRPAAGFALVGLLGIYVPEIFGNGYETVNQVLRGGLPLGLVLILPFLKVAATALTMGSGGSGGLFTPTLFVGSMLGFSYGSWCGEAFPGLVASPGVYALVGMGAMVAGTTQAPLTAILTIFELTGDYQMILPLMFSCTVAMVVGRLLHPESIYTEALAERGVRLGGRIEELVMDAIEVRDVMRVGAPPVRDDDPLEVVLQRLMNEGRKELFVVDGEGRFRGALTLAELSDHLGRPEALRTTRAGEVAYTEVPVLTQSDRLSEAIERWSRVSRDRLPVIDGSATRRYVGELSAGDIISLYSQEVLHKEARLARFDRPGGGRPETTYVELPPEFVVAQVTLPPAFGGATLRDLDARRRLGINILEVKRPLPAGQERRIIPDPEMELRPGDSLIVVGRPADIARLSDPVRLAEAASRKEAPPAPEGAAG